MVKAEGELAAEVAAWLERAAQADAVEDTEHGSERRGDEPPDRMRDKQARLERIRAAKAELEAEAKAAQAARCRNGPAAWAWAVGRLSLRVMVCGTGSERVGPRHHRGTAMEYYAGIDVSLKDSSVCVVDGGGKIVREAKVASEPEALIAWFGGLGLEVARIGLEAGPLSQWLHAGLSEAGFEAVLLETRHVKAALSAMTVK